MGILEEEAGGGLDTAEVLARFAQLAELGEEDAQRHTRLCEIACRQVDGLAREDVPGGGTVLLTELAAALAFYRWTLQTAALDLGGFSGADFRVEQSGANVDFAYRLWREAEAAAAPYLRDAGFTFTGVAV